jgi:predicted kinase
VGTSILFIVSGPPSSGKTTLAKAIATKFNLPLITKDSLKEILFDTIGWQDRAWSRRLGSASFSLLHYILDAFMITGQPIIIEGNFKPEFESHEISSRLKKFNYLPFQIMCQTDGRVLFDRFKRRSESGDRHPGHCDTGNYDELKPDLIKGKYLPLDIGGQVITFDTTDLKNIDYQPVFNQISKLLK